MSWNDATVSRCRPPPAFRRLDTRTVSTPVAARLPQHSVKRKERRSRLFPFWDLPRVQRAIIAMSAALTFGHLRPRSRLQDLDCGPEESPSPEAPVQGPAHRAEGPGRVALSLDAGPSRNRTSGRLILRVSRAVTAIIFCCSSATCVAEGQRSPRLSFL